MTASSGTVVMLVSPIRATGLRLFAWLGLLLCGLFVLVFAGWYGYIADVGVRIGLQVAAFLIVGGWLALCAVRPYWLPRGPLVLPVIAATAIFVLSGLLSQRQRLSVESVAQGVVVAMLFLMLIRLSADEWFRNRIRVLLVAILACRCRGVHRPGRRVLDRLVGHGWSSSCCRRCDRTGPG